MSRRQIGSWTLGAAQAGPSSWSPHAAVSFLEVIQAIEGTASWFHCAAGLAHAGCLIQEVMAEAEQRMDAYLHERKLVELVGQLNDVRALV